MQGREKKVETHIVPQFFLQKALKYKIIKGKTFLPNPGHKPGFLPVFLKEHEAEVIIAGGMGETAQTLFNENGIEVVVGAQGNMDHAVKLYLEGNLQSSGSICTEHAHEGHCND